jgi:spore maturation protein CgeB
MRILVVHPGPNFSVADVHTGLIKGLMANGCEVVDFNLDHRLSFYTNAHLKKNGEYIPAFDYEAACAVAAKGLESACYEFWPDVVIVMSGFFVPPDIYRLMRDRTHHVVLWFTESPYEDDRQLLQASHADTVIVNDPTNLDRFREVNARTFYIGHGYDPHIHNPHGLKQSLRSDFCFVGTGYQSRIDFLEKVDWHGIQPVLAGNWTQVTDDSPLIPFLLHERGECIDNTDTADLYRATRVSANLYRKEAEHDAHAYGWAMGPREIELAACHTFFAREPRGEGDDVLWMLPTFTEPAELGDLIRWYLEHGEERDVLAAKAAEAVAGRTFQANAAELLDLI